MKNKILKFIKILLDTWIEASSGIVTILIFMIVLYGNHIVINTHKQAIIFGMTSGITGIAINKIKQLISRHISEE